MHDAQPEHSIPAQSGQCKKTLHESHTSSSTHAFLLTATAQLLHCRTPLYSYPAATLASFLNPCNPENPPASAPCVYPAPVCLHVHTPDCMSPSLTAPTPLLAHTLPPQHTFLSPSTQLPTLITQSPRRAAGGAPAQGAQRAAGQGRRQP